MLANFLGVLPILTPPLCAKAFIMCSKSNPLVVFALDLSYVHCGQRTSLHDLNLSNFYKLILYVIISSSYRILFMYLKRVSILLFGDSELCSSVRSCWLLIVFKASIFC
jgi:hypothetical protein